MFNKIKRHLHIFQIEYAYISILFLSMIYYLPMINELHTFCVIPYTLNYEFGFISRGFIGSILSLFFSYKSSKLIYIVIFISQILLCLITVYYLHLIKMKSDNDNKNVIVFISFLFLINPASISFLFYWGNYGRFDLYMIAITLICCIVIIKGKSTYVIPILCTIGILIHQGFIFSYFPVILILLFYKALSERKNYVLLSFTLIITSILFLYIQFRGKIYQYDLQQVVYILQGKTDFPIDPESLMIKLEYFTPILSFISAYVIPNLKVNVFKCIVVIILLLPIEIILYNIWKEFLILKNRKLYLIFPIFPLIAILPKFIITIDYGRDFASIFISEFLLIFTLFAIGSAEMKHSLTILYNSIVNNKLLYLFALIEISIIGKFEAANILEISNKFYNIFNFMVN